MLAATLLTLAACGTVRVPMDTQVTDLRVPRALPLRATLLVSALTREYPFEGKPESEIPVRRTYAFPLGAELERAARQAFGQVFQRLDVVRETPPPQDMEVLVQPDVMDFHFGYALTYGGFAVAARARIQIRVTVMDGAAVVWTQTRESPDESSGPWIFDLSPETHVGRAASRALAGVLRDLAGAASIAPELWQLAEKARRERGPLRAP